MIESIEIRNFRCFRHLEPVSLKRFNVIVGESGSGKTSLMEALFLHGGGSLEIYFRLRSWRGFAGAPTVAGTKESWELIFRDMFYSFDISRVPRITSIDSDSGRREVEIFFKNQDSYSLPLTGVDENAFVIRPVVFKWVVNGTVYESTIDREEGAYKVKGSAPVSPIVYFNPVNGSMSQTSAAFSGLSRHIGAGILLEEVRRSFPFVEDINLEIIGGEATIHLATGLSERLPLGDASGGVMKFITIALGILANRGGVVLIDEIEGSFYYKNVPDVWDSLTRLCIVSNAQIVATTHSYEFLKGISRSMDDQAVSKNFQLLRMSRVDNDQPIVKRVKGVDYLAAIENDYEVR